MLSLVLADTTGGSATRPEAQRLEQLHSRLEAAGDPADLARRRAPALLSPRASPELVAEVEAIMAEIHPAGYRRAAYALSYADSSDFLPRRFADQRYLPHSRRDYSAGPLETTTAAGRSRRSFNR